VCVALREGPAQKYMNAERASRGVSACMRQVISATKVLVSMRAIGTP
jgi:hypothetical protein